MTGKHYFRHEKSSCSKHVADWRSQTAAEPVDADNSSMTFFIYYVAVCIVLVLALASLLDPYAVLIGMGMAMAIALSIWLTANLAEMLDEYLKSGD